jgi:hypothetical protein
MPPRPSATLLDQVLRKHWAVGFSRSPEELPDARASVERALAECLDFHAALARRRGRDSSYAAVVRDLEAGWQVKGQPTAYVLRDLMLARGAHFQEATALGTIYAQYEEEAENLVNSMVYKDPKTKEFTEFKRFADDWPGLIIFLTEPRTARSRLEVYVGKGSLWNFIEASLRHARADWQDRMESKERKHVEFDKDCEGVVCEFVSRIVVALLSQVAPENYQAFQRHYGYGVAQKEIATEMKCHRGVASRRIGSVLREFDREFRQGLQDAPEVVNCLQTHDGPRPIRIYASCVRVRADMEGLDCR